MTVQIHKMVILTILMIFTIFRKSYSTRLCVGTQSGNAGFCVDPNDQTAVDDCENNDFTIEDDELSACQVIGSLFDI